MIFLTLPEIKDHLAITTPDDDAILSQQIDAAIASLTQFLGVDLDATYWDGTSPNPSSLPQLPPDLREALKQLAGHMFQNRELALIGTSASIVPWGVYDLVSPFRVYRF